MKKLAFVALFVSGVAVSACVPPTMYDEQAMYRPGGALADKQSGPAVLANINDAAVNAMFPKGTQKSTVMQSLGVPMSTSTSSDGTSTQTYMYSLTSYQRKIVQSNVLTVKYDRNNAVETLTLSASNNTW
ncbi:hypothetical protein TSH100_12395 [Azospirillum sp. TSH100]|uniref:hypothetical protein n=1 Tax=Azospirillum sp. TSH100 TaxID=652764 RepID=UPI000D6042F6|nr:hypothetical protein [Azospirillum sp. TSH100]PWC86562.1 hypothetical protein TSH100_12395 [Azospirillum sp. TSH100]QCG88484.1 hypothetical protein E6C72_12650 [Azospirillum sp. TSH100]